MTFCKTAVSKTTIYKTEKNTFSTKQALRFIHIRCLPHRCRTSGFATFILPMLLHSRPDSIGIPASFGSIKPGSFAEHRISDILRLHSPRPKSRKTMIGLSRFVTSFSSVGRGSVNLLFSTVSQIRMNSTFNEDPKLHEFMDYMAQLKNYEKLGVPKDAGTDSDDGFDLGRMRRLLQRLGNPHSSFKAVHVAGTKGKGSTAAFLSNILREEGYSVGCYTSPHLTTIRERISLGRNGGAISVELMCNIFCQSRGILDLSIELEGGALTHFEVFTALAFALFAQQGVDVAVIEAGLGGARDATNVFCSTRLAASVITSIGEEHLLALGGTLESIAMAKAGIIKLGRPVVVGSPLQPNIEHIIMNKASSLCCPVVSACDAGAKSITRFYGRDQEIPYQTCDIHIKFEDMSLFLDLPNVKLKMLGCHQLQNAVTATCAALCLRREGWRISPESIQTGLEKTCLPGRGQYLTKKEVATLGLSGVSILIDGAHTEASAKGLIDIMKMENSDGLLALVVSMASDKDHAKFAMQLLSGRRPDVVILTETGIAGGRSRTTSASTLKDAWVNVAASLGIHAFDLASIDQQKADGQVLLIAHPNTHIGKSLQLADELLRSKSGDKPRLIVVTGSLHIVSSVLALL